MHVVYLPTHPTILSTLNMPNPLSPDNLDAALVALIRKAWHDGIIQVPRTEGSAPPPPSEDSAGIEDIAAVQRLLDPEGTSRVPNQGA